MDNSNKGLDGLGNINTNNASATVATPYGYLNKVEVDSRKIEVDVTKFADGLAMKEYYARYFTEVCGLQCHDARDQETDVTQGVPSIYTTVNVNNNMQKTYKVYFLREASEVQKFTTPGQIPAGIQAKVVLVVYTSVSKLSQLERALKKNGVEPFSYEDIQDINSALDLADKKLPYVGTGSEELSTIISKILNAKYRQTATQGLIDSEGMKAEVNGVGSSFQEGINQLKGSITDAIGSLKGSFGSQAHHIPNPNIPQNQQQLTMPQNFGQVHNYGQQQNFGQGQQENNDGNPNL